MRIFNSYLKFSKPRLPPEGTANCHVHVNLVRFLERWWTQTWATTVYGPVQILHCLIKSQIPIKPFRSSKPIMPLLKSAQTAHSTFRVGISSDSRFA